VMYTLLCGMHLSKFCFFQHPFDPCIHPCTHTCFCVAFQWYACQV
jgi:hypothetical protein